MHSTVLPRDDIDKRRNHDRDRVGTADGWRRGNHPAGGLRYPVETLLELLSAGMTIEGVLADYPDLERDDILAALAFGALAAGRRRVVPLGAP